MDSFSVMGDRGRIVGRGGFVLHLRGWMVLVAEGIAFSKALLCQSPRLDFACGGGYGLGCSSMGWWHGGWCLHQTKVCTPLIRGGGRIPLGAGPSRMRGGLCSELRLPSPQELIVMGTACITLKGTLSDGKAIELWADLSPSLSCFLCQGMRKITWK